MISHIQIYSSQQPPSQTPHDNNPDEKEKARYYMNIRNMERANAPSHQYQYGYAPGPPGYYGNEYEFDYLGKLQQLGGNLGARD